MMCFWTYRLQKTCLERQKRSSFRGALRWQHGKRANTQFKVESQRLYHIYWSLYKKFRLKKSLWVICSILGLFVNSLTANNKYFLLNRDNLLQHFQMHLSQKWKIFSFFFFSFLHFLNLYWILNIFKKTMTLVYLYLYFLLKCIFELTDSEKHG